MSLLGLASSCTDVNLFEHSRTNPQAQQRRGSVCQHAVPCRRPGRNLAKRKRPGSQLRSTRGQNTASQQEFSPSSDPAKALFGGQVLEKATAFWQSFSEQAASPATWLSGASTATAAVLLAFPFHSSFHSNVSQILAARPADVSADTWLLSIAISSVLPAAIYLGMTWRVLHAIKHSSPDVQQSSKEDSDRAVAVVAAVCIKNAQTIERLIALLDGLDSHPSLGASVKRLRETTRKQLDLQQLMFSKMEVQKEFKMRQHLESAVQSCSAELALASITPEEATNMLDHTLADLAPPMSLMYKIDRYDKLLALMVLRQRGMRLTIITILDDLAVRLPQVRRNVMIVRKQFAERFRYEDIMMQQITPADYDATEKVRELLHTKEMASKLAGLDMTPDALLKSLLGPWGPFSPQTDLERHKMEKCLTGQAADSLEVRSAKQDLEKLLDLQPPQHANAASSAESAHLDAETASETQAVQSDPEQNSRPADDTDHDRTQQ